MSERGQEKLMTATNMDRHITHLGDGTAEHDHNRPQIRDFWETPMKGSRFPC